MAKKNINFNTYVERDLTKTTVDWGTVANNLTTQLGEIRKDREQRRADIDDNTIEVEDRLNTLEEYTNQTLQNLALGMSGDSASFLRVQTDLFKRGQITETQYAQAKQRVLGDWKQFGNISKKFESQYAEMKGRIDSTEGSVFEAIFSQQNAEFGNLKNVTGYVNPATGNLSLVQLDENGKIPDDPSKHVSMNVINNRFNTRVDNVSYKDGLTNKLKSKVDTLGELILTTVEANGEVFSIEGQQQALQEDNIQAFLDSTAKQYTTNPNTVFSILGDINGDYRPTFDANEAAADPYKVLVEYNADGIPVPVKEGTNWDTQVAAAQEIVKDKMILMLDRKESAKAGDVYTRYQREVIRTKDEANALMKKNVKDDKKLTLEDTKYRPPNYSGNAYDKFGTDVNTDVNQWIIKNIGTSTAGNTDVKLTDYFKKMITGTMDSNMFLDLDEGRYPDLKGLNLVYDDGGSPIKGDYFTVKLGKEELRYPPIKDVILSDGTVIPGIGPDTGGMYPTVQEGLRGGPYEDPKLIFKFLQDQLINPVSEEMINRQTKNRADAATDLFGNPLE